MSKKAVLFLAIFIAIDILAVLGYLLFTGSLGPGGRARQLEAHYDKWRAQNLTDYTAQVGIGCFCPFFDRMPVTVEVVDGRVVSAVDALGQAVAEDDPIRTVANADLLTVEGAFAYARRAIREADKVEIAYHEQLGYPVSLSIDWIELAMDDEMSLTIAELHALP